MKNIQEIGKNPRSIHTKKIKQEWIGNMKLHVNRPKHKRYEEENIRGREANGEHTLINNKNVLSKNMVWKRKNDKSYAQIVTDNIVS